MENLVKNTQQWFVDRNLHTADPDAQLLKLGEEIGELFEGVAKNNLLLIKDAIGDALVVLIGYSLQRDLEVSFTQEWVITPTPVRTHLFGLGSSIYDLYMTGNVYHISYMIGDLTIIAHHYGLTLEECLEHAYNEIKDRKGKLIDGVFVKEEDLCQQD